MLRDHSRRSGPLALHDLVPRADREAVFCAEGAIIRRMRGSSITKRFKLARIRNARGYHRAPVGGVATLKRGFGLSSRRSVAVPPWHFAARRHRERWLSPKELTGRAARIFASESRSMRQKCSADYTCNVSLKVF